MSCLNAAEMPGTIADEKPTFRQEIGHISSQSAVYFAGTAFAAGAGYIFKIYLARVLGAKALGIYALGMTVVGVFSLAAAVGVPQMTARYVAAYKATSRWQQLRSLLWWSFAILLGTNGLVGVAMILSRHWIAIRVYHAAVLSDYMVFFAAILLIGSFTTLLGQILAGYKDVARRTVITNFIGSPLTMLLSIALLTLGMGLKGYLLAQIASAAVVLALLAVSAWNLTPPSARSALMPPSVDREVIFFSSALFASAVLEFVVGKFDKVVLGYYLDARSVGIYAGAGVIAALLPMLLQSVNQIFSPVIAELCARDDRVTLQRLYQTLSKWILGLTLPLAMVVCFFAPQCMELFGNEFKSGWPILVIATVGELINCGVGSVGLLLVMSGHQNRLVGAQIKVAVASIALNLFLIPLWGMLGAAVAAAIANAMINLFYLWEVRKCLGLSPYHRGYSRLGLPLASSLIITILIRSVMNTAGSALLCIVASLLLSYGACVFLAFWVGLDADEQAVALALKSTLLRTFHKGRMAAWS